MESLKEEKEEKDFYAEHYSAMTVRELINKLKALPQDEYVWSLWDGEPRTVVNTAYESKAGLVIVGKLGDRVYSDVGRPKDAPSEGRVDSYKLGDENEVN